MFSKPISFTYNGEENFATFIGGVMSIVILSILFAYGAVKFLTMINREDSNTSFNRVVNDLTSSGTSVNLGDSTFYFAMGIDNSGSNLLFNSSYIDMKMTYVVNSGGKTTSSTISYDIWSSTNMPASG